MEAKEIEFLTKVYTHSEYGEDLLCLVNWMSDFCDDLDGRQKEIITGVKDVISYFYVLEQLKEAKSKKSSREKSWLE